MNKKYSLRPASTDDFAQIVQIEQKVHVAPWTEENFRTEVAKPYSQVLVLSDDETDSDIVGYVVFWMMIDECQILNIAVALEHRGLGLAKQMIRKVVQLTYQKGIKKIILNVNNQP